MAFIGSQEIILLAIVFFILLLPIAVIGYFLYVIFHSRGRIDVLEDRIAKLEKDAAREKRLDALENRIDEMKK